MFYLFIHSFEKGRVSGICQDQTTIIFTATESYWPPPPRQHLNMSIWNCIRSSCVFCNKILFTYHLSFTYHLRSKVRYDMNYVTLTNKHRQTELVFYPTRIFRTCKAKSGKMSIYMWPRLPSRLTSTNWGNAVYFLSSSLNV